MAACGRPEGWCKPPGAAEDHPSMGRRTACERSNRGLWPSLGGRRIAVPQIVLLEAGETPGQGIGWLALAAVCPCGPHRDSCCGLVAPRTIFALAAGRPRTFLMALWHTRLYVECNAVNLVSAAAAPYARFGGKLCAVIVEHFGSAEFFGLYSAIFLRGAKMLRDLSPTGSGRRADAGHTVPGSPMRLLTHWHCMRRELFVLLRGIDLLILQPQFVAPGVRCPFRDVCPGGRGGACARLGTVLNCGRGICREAGVIMGRW
jgi:hypothetical protein